MILKNHLHASSPSEAQRAIGAASEACAALSGAGQRMHFGFELAGGELR